MATTKRAERLVDASSVRPGDEVRWSMRDKAYRVNQVESVGGRVKITLSSGAWRTYAPDDRIIRLDPKPESASDRRTWK